MIDFGAIVRYYRLFLGFRQEDMVGIFENPAPRHSRSAYTYKELGTTRFLLEELLAIAAFFGIPPRAFCYPQLCDSVAIGKRTHRHSRKRKPLYIYDLSLKEREIIARYRSRFIVQK